MELVKLNDYNFSYPSKKILNNINLTINSGDFALICGPSGCGKTTLLRNLKNEIRPNGNESGEILYKNEDIRKLDKITSASEIGFLFQNPENQFVCDTVIQELSFALENLGIESDEIRSRVAEMTTFFGLNNLLYENIDNLSGGQKQLINLCSLLILKPKLLILDEPTSQLDPIASHDFLSILRRLNEEFAITIIMTEHRIDNVFPLINKTVFIDNGKIKEISKPTDIPKNNWNHPIFSNYLPSTSLVHLLFTKYYSFIESDSIPISIKDGLNDMHDLNLQLTEKKDTCFYDEYLNLKQTNTIKTNNNDEILNCKNIWFSYDGEKIITKNISLTAKKGEFISILGGNGSGKSTLMQLLAKIQKPIKGKIKFSKGLSVSYVHQNPMVHLEEETVAKELNILNLEDIDENTMKLIKFFKIEDLLNNNPYDCSGGEQQKIVIVKSLLNNPDILFLDEPTKGLDPIFKEELGQKFKELQKTGLTIIMITHDMDFASDYTERTLFLFDGNIQIDSNPKELFNHNKFYTTFVNRMVKNYIPECITLKDLKNTWK